MKQQKIKANKRSCFILIGLLLATVCSLSQSNEQMIVMVKNMIQQFEEVKAENLESDEVLSNGAPFDPNIDLSDKNLYQEGLKNISASFSLTEYENGYALVGNRELPTNGINLLYSFHTLPGFFYLNAWCELSSFEDAKGKELRLAERDLEKYRKLGIIDDDFYYPVAGEFSERQWLKRELVHGEALKVKGSVFLEYPSEYESIAFDKGDAGESKSIGKSQITLLEIDQNMVTLLVKGDRNAIEGLQMKIFNAEGKMFLSTSSNGIDSRMFDAEKMAIRELSDAEIAASVEDFDMSNMEIEQVKKIKVFGHIQSLIFMKISELEILELPFVFSMNF